MSGLLSNFLARDLFSDFCLMSGELDPMLTLLFIQPWSVLLEMELAVVQSVIQRKTHMEHRCGTQTDLHINFSPELEHMADFLWTLYSLINWDQLDLNSSPFASACSLAGSLELDFSWSCFPQWTIMRGKWGEGIHITAPRAHFTSFSSFPLPYGMLYGQCPSKAPGYRSLRPGYANDSVLLNVISSKQINLHPNMKSHCYTSLPSQLLRASTGWSQSQIFVKKQ